MEKRVALAFILSFFVLYVWSVLNPPPSKPRTNNAQIFINKEVKSESLPAIPKNVGVTVAKPSSFAEKTQILENQKLQLTFSNKGGNLHQVLVKPYNYTFPLTDVLSVDQFQDFPFEPTGLTANSITYTYKGDGYTVAKTYQLAEDDYLVHTTIAMSPSLDNFKINAARVDNNNVHSDAHSFEAALSEYSVFQNIEVIRKRNAVKFSEKERHEYAGQTNWVGYRDRYFCAVIKPEKTPAKVLIDPIDEKRLDIEFIGDAQNFAEYGKIVFKSVAFFGPQDYNLLKTYKEGFDKIVDFKIGGFFDIMAFGLTDVIAKALLILLNFLYKITSSWGASIILFAILMFIATYPLTLKSLTSMKRMQALQPEIKKLQDRNKNNPQKLNKEMGEFFRENKINPFGGCFPMLLQMPIFMGLYQLLWRSVAFKGADFWWIKDLSEPDRLFKFSAVVPLFGQYFNLLPILYALTMFVNQRLTSKNMVITDPAQAAQQKMMAILFPIILGYAFYNFASGLTLYFTIFYTLNTIAQWKMTQTVKVAK